ncbi:MAG: hypothetical protein HPY61_10140 [Methanotrichaceae archaeon]|nr:hypothetical protein [Methanotrichaceae archaeon]
MTVLAQDSNQQNISDMNLTYYTATEDFGLDGLFIGEAVKFTAPSAGWNLKQVQVLGWNGFNESTGTVPAASNFLIEIRDANLNLLYRLADTQNAYFTYPIPVIRSIDIPAIPVTGDFYVVFYDRGSMLVFMEQEEGSGNSYFFNSGNKQLEPAQFTVNSTNETLKVNWLIRAAGE